MNNKKLFIVWIGVILILVIVIIFKYYPKKIEEKTSIPSSERLRIEKIEEKNGKELLHKKPEEILKEKAEEASYRYFEEQAEWAGIGEGED